MALVEKLLTPAKVNLYLRVLGRRADGYHLLDSLVVPISLFDELQVAVTPHRPGMDTTVRVISDSAAAPGDPSNLAHRAAALFLARCGRAATVRINLRKRIPVGAGLGGGSSDAAAVLLALNRLLGAPYDREALAHMAVELGADVPFFVYGVPARVHGIGEQVSPVSLPDQPALLVCWDHYALSTKDVYSRVDLSLTRPSGLSNITPFVSGRKLSAELLVNDLETAAAQVHPAVLALKSRLTQEGAIGTLMTGSGAAVFGIFPETGSAQGAAERLQQCGLWAAAVAILAESPAAVP